MQWFAGLLAILIGGMFSGCEHKAPEAANAKKSIIVASEASFPPMEFIDDKEQIVGFDVDVISAAALAAGMNVEIRNVAWDGIFGALKDGQADVIASSVTITDERKAQFDFTRPYYKAGQCLLVRTADKAKYPSIEALKGKAVGVQLSTTGADYMQKLGGYEVKQYNTAGLAIIDLANGLIEGVLIDKPVADYHAAKKPEFKDKVAVVGQPQTSEQFGFVVRKGETELLKKLNAALEELERNGTLRKLEAKWFG
jgi:polar amino acid transport system substrate-binding protein